MIAPASLVAPSALDHGTPHELGVEPGEQLAAVEEAAP